MSTETQVQYKPFGGTDYVYCRIVAEGISGEVLFGQHKATGQQVVIKRPNVEQLTERDRQQREIKRELRALQLLKEKRVPDVCKYLGDGMETYRSGSEPYPYTYVVMELAVGEALRDWVERLRRQKMQTWPWGELLAVVSRFVHVLVRAHDVGLVYNDAKLDHLFWDRQTDTLRVIDWANAYFYRESPESSDDHPVTPAADLVQVGQMLSELVTGSRTPPTADARQLHDAPPGLWDIIEHALKTEYSSAMALGRDLIALCFELGNAHRTEVDALQSRLKAGTMSLEELRSAIAQIQEWQRETWRLDQPETVTELLESALKQIQNQEQIERQKQQEARKGIFEAVLAGGDWAQAASLLEEIERDEGQLRNRRLRALRILCAHIAGGNVPDMQDVTRFVATESYEPAFLTLIKVLETVGPLSAPLNEALPLLALLANVPAIYLHIKWLHSRLTAQENAGQVGHPSRLALGKARLDVEQLLAPPEDGLTIEAWRDWYAQVHKTLSQQSSALTQATGAENETLTGHMARLAVNAKEIAAEMSNAQAEFRRRSFGAGADSLARAEKMDPTNPALGTLNRVAASLDKEWDKLDKVTRGTDVATFETWLSAARTLLNNIEPIDQVLKDRQNAIRDIEQYWGEYKETRGQVRPGLKALDNAEKAARDSFPGVADFLRNHRSQLIKDEPWQLECESDDVAELISSGVEAWRSANLDEAMSKAAAAKAIPKLDQCRSRAWVEWLDNLLRLTKALQLESYQDILKYDTRLRDWPQTYAKSDFLRQWVKGYELPYKGNYEDALSALVEAKKMAPKDYHPSIDVAYESALQKFKEGRLKNAEDHLSRGDLRRAKEVLNALRNWSALDSRGERYLEALEGKDKGIEAWLAGRYSVAEDQLQKAADSLGDLTTQASTALKASIQRDSEQLKAAHKRLQQGITNAGKQGADSHKAWDTLKSALADMEKEARLAPRSGSQSPSGIIAQRDGHDQASRVYWNRQTEFPAFVQKLDQEAPHHPFLNLYERWAGPLEKKPDSETNGNGTPGNAKRSPAEDAGEDKAGREDPSSLSKKRGKPPDTTSKNENKDRGQLPSPTLAPPKDGCAQWLDRLLRAMIIVPVAICLVIFGVWWLTRALDSEPAMNTERSTVSPAASATRSGKTKITQSPVKGAPSATSTWTPEALAVQPILSSLCDQVARMLEGKDWEGVLSTAADPVHGTQLRTCVGIVDSVTRAGEESMSSYFASKQWQRTIAAGQQTFDALNQVAEPPPALPPWRIDLYWRAAEYFAYREQNPAQALQALEALSQHNNKTETVPFLFDTQQVLGVDFDTARTELQDRINTPTPSLPAMTPALTTAQLKWIDLLPIEYGQWQAEKAVLDNIIYPLKWQPKIYNFSILDPYLEDYDLLLQSSAGFHPQGLRIAGTMVRQGEFGIVMNSGANRYCLVWRPASGGQGQAEIHQPDGQVILLGQAVSSVPTLELQITRPGQLRFAAEWEGGASQSEDLLYGSSGDYELGFYIAGSTRLTQVRLEALSD